MLLTVAGCSVCIQVACQCTALAAYRHRMGQSSRRWRSLRARSAQRTRARLPTLRRPCVRTSRTSALPWVADMATSWAQPRSTAGKGMGVTARVCL